MWIALAAGSAVFAGAASILAKVGMKNVDSTLATALRTIVVAIFAWLIVWISGVYSELSVLSAKSLLFLILSGLATGASWLCYFKALQNGPLSQVVAIDKCSTLLTILLSFVLLHETVSVYGIIGTLLLAAGTALMLDPWPWPSHFKTSAERSKKKDTQKTAAWIFYAAGSAFFAALTSILAKVGIEHVDSNLGTAIRTIVVLIMAWIMVFIGRKQSAIRLLSKTDILFLVLSGLATGSSWLCFFAALQQGPAYAVVSIDKLSILVSVAFSVWFLHEHLSARSLCGLALLFGGTLLLLL